MRKEAIDRHCDLMRQGLTKMIQPAVLTAQQIEDGKRQGESILRKIDAFEAALTK